MKKVLLLLLLSNYNGLAQKYENKIDTIRSHNTTCIAISSLQNQDCFFLQSLTGTPLMEVHPARISIENKPGFIVTFLNDKKQAFFTADKIEVGSLEQLLVQGKLIYNNKVDIKKEGLYVKRHPFPKGYIDVKDFNDIELE